MKESELLLESLVFTSSTAWQQSHFTSLDLSFFIHKMREMMLILSKDTVRDFSFSLAIFSLFQWKVL